MTTENTTNLDTVDVTALEVVYNLDGHCIGPDYGQVVAYNGGFISGYRSESHPGLGLMDREFHKTKKAAYDRAVRLSDI